MACASAKVGTSLPTPAKLSCMFFPLDLPSCALDFSPTTTRSEFGFSSSILLVALDRPEWIPPQRPLSDEQTMMRVFLSSDSRGLVSAFSKTVLDVSP